MGPKTPDVETLVECTPRKVVLRRSLDDDAARMSVDTKKTMAFRTLFAAPRQDEIHTHSVRVAYEATTMLSGTYRTSYYRKAVHTIRVDHNVQRIEIGDGVFNARPKSRLALAIPRSKAKGRVDVELEEYVVDENEGSIFIDHHGREVRNFRHSLKPTSLESYPSRVLKKAEIVRDSELTSEALIERLCNRLITKPERGDMRDVEDRVVIKKITEIYVPIIEAKLVGPKRRTRMLRIDAVSKKALKV